MLKKLTSIALIVLLMAFSGMNASVAAPTFGGKCGGLGNCADNLVALSQTDIDGLMYMREEEKLARDIYLMMAEEWNLLVFSNIARAEQKHMDAVKHLLDKYGLQDPVSDESPAVDGSAFTNSELGVLFDSFKQSGLLSEIAALQVGGEIEETDLLDIQAEIDLTDKPDITSLYENLMCGSANHFRAFVKQLEINGESYQPLYLSDDELQAIVGSPITRKCGKKMKK